MKNTTCRLDSTKRLCLASLTSLSCVLVGCDINSYVPSAENLQNGQAPSRAFIVQEQEIRGIYGNMDVDSVIYTYRTDAADEGGFWVSIDKLTEKDDWSRSESRPNWRSYVRIIPKKKQQALHSVEEVRVAFLPASQRVIVAWVQADERALPKDFPTSGPEGGFAQRVIWPRFEQEIKHADGS